MKYGMLCAMPEEIDLLKSDFEVEKVTTIAKRDFYEGKLYGQDAVLALSRIGKVAAAATTALLIDHFGAGCVIFSGTAGGVGEGLHVGDVVVADRLAQHDFFTGVDWFRIPLLNKSYFDSDAALAGKLRAAVEEYAREELHRDIPVEILEKFHIRSPKAVTGTIASGDQFICDPAVSIRLKERLENLQCVEMEGAAAAQVCYEFGVPCAVVRVISDSADENSNVDFEEFVREAACRLVRGYIRAYFRRLPRE